MTTTDPDHIFKWVAETILAELDAIDDLGNGPFLGETALIGIELWYAMLRSKWAPQYMSRDWQAMEFGGITVKPGSPHKRRYVGPNETERDPNYIAPWSLRVGYAKTWRVHDTPEMMIALETIYDPREYDLKWRPAIECPQDHRPIATEGQA